MSGIELVENQLSLGFLFGSEHPFFLFSKTTVLHTLIMLGVMAIILILIKWIVFKKDNIARFITLEFIRFFIDMCNQSIGSFSFTHFSFITALFIFILFCNIISILPWLEEPTTNLNTTLALGIIAFVYTQIAAIYANGMRAYIQDYFSPFFIMFPLNFVGKVASVVSISFRLFGNIFGGSIITNIYFGAIQGSLIAEAIGLITGFNIMLVLFFGLFEGFLQAFVFAMLSLTYLSIALQSEGN